MKNLDCNQTKIFIILEIIGEENYIYIYIYILKNLKKNSTIKDALKHVVW